MIELFMFQVKKLKNVLFTTSLKDLKLDEPGKANDTYKTLGAGFWALKQKDFRSAVQEIVMEVGGQHTNNISRLLGDDHWLVQ